MYTVRWHMEKYDVENSGCKLCSSASHTFTDLLLQMASKIKSSERGLPRFQEVWRWAFVKTDWNTLKILNVKIEDFKTA